ncbi:MAG: tetratricopeptide repeat protein [bacterium]
MKRFALSIAVMFLSCVLLGSCSQKNMRLNILQKNIKKTPNSAKAHNDLAYFYDENGEYEKAIKEYEKSLEIRPGDFLATNNMGQSYFNLGDYEKAREIFSDLTKKRSKDSRVQSNLAMSYHRLEMYPEAVKHYRKALELSPNNKNAQDGFGILKEEIKAKGITLESLEIPGEDDVGLQDEEAVESSDEAAE